MNYSKGISMILILFFFVSFITVEVEAHSDIEEIKPDITSKFEVIPEKIEIIFAEPIYLYSDAIQIKDSQGNLVENKEPTINHKDNKNILVPLPDDLLPGTYTVFIDVIAMDGHELNEQFTFEISQLVEVKVEETKEDENHLKFEKSIPNDGEIVKESPERIEIFFTDELDNDKDILFGLFNDQMMPIEIKDEYINPENSESYVIELKEPLEGGSYQANWYNQGDDGGERGIFYFALNEVTSIDNPKSSLTVTYTTFELNNIAKWISYVGVFLLFGTMFFQLLISRGTEYLGRWNKIVHLFYITTFTGFTILLISRLNNLKNVPFSEILSFQFMWVTFAQLIFLVIAYWIKPMKYRFLVISTVILLWSFTGHSSIATHHGGFYAFFFDLIHLFSAAIWLGGLFALIIMIPKEKPGPWFKKYGKLYSEVAFFSMIALFLSGVGMTILYLPSFSLESLMVSTWGRLLLLKIALFIFILIFGLFQRKFLKSKKEFHTKTVSIVSKTEVIIGLIIIFLAASLISSSPRTAEQGIYQRPLVPDNDINVSVEIRPFKVGNSDMIIEVDTEQSIESVEIVLTMQPNYEREQQAFYIGDGKYKVTGGLLHAPGTMTLDVLVETSNGEVVEIPYIIQVPGETMNN